MKREECWNRYAGCDTMGELRGASSYLGDGSAMRIAYLGPLEAFDGAGHLSLGGPKQRLVLARLLVARGGTVEADRLIDALWEASPPATARNTVQTYVSHLRGILGHDLLEGGSQGYRLRLNETSIDAARFEELAARGSELVSSDPAAASDHLDDALRQWRGRPFGDLGDVSALRGEVARLEELRAQAIDHLLTAKLRLGATGQLLAELEASVADDPLRERRWELLLVALYRSGRQADALLAYERVRTLLAETVGADPGPGLQDLHRRILAQDPDLLPDRSVDVDHRRAPAHRDGGQVVEVVEADRAGLGSERAAAGPGAEGEARDSMAMGGGGSLPFPTRLVTSTALPFVGRKGELARLRHGWERARDGGVGHLAVLHGEPGVGKTRLAVELAGEVIGGGGLVLAGACDDGLALPYQPFAEMLDQQTWHAADLPLGRYLGELVRLLPDLAERVRPLPPAISSDARIEEHRLYEATASWLRAVAADQGLLVVVDDLQWATEPTLRLLHHVARATAGDPSARMLIVAGYRDTDVDDAHPLQGVLASLSRLGDRISSFALSNLTADDVRELVAAVADADADEAAELAERTYVRTAGNPFFVGEVLRPEVDTGDDGHGWAAAGADDVAEGDDSVSAGVAVSRVLDGVPAGARQVVRERIRPLPAGTVEVLQVAAVLGSDARIAIVAELVDGSVAQVIDALEVGIRARLLTETGPDRFALAHDLVRQVLLDELSETRRRRLHAAIVEALEAKQPDDVVALATHAVAAGALDGSRERALRYTIAAGRRAAQQRAAPDAVRWYRLAVGLLEEGAEQELELRTRLALGDAQRAAGDQGYRETLLSVTDDALSGDRIDLALEAAVLNHRPAMASVVGAPDGGRIARLERLHTVLADPQDHLDDQLAPGGGVDAWRARIAALLSIELTFDATQYSRRLALGSEAVELARRVGDPAVHLWTSTTARMPLMVPDHVDRLAATMPGLVEPADLTGDPALRCVARLSAHNTSLSIGAFGEAQRWILEADQLAREEGAPFLQMTTSFHALQFVAYEGRFAEAHAVNARCLESAQELGESDAIVWWSGIESLLAFLEGTLPALADQIGPLADVYPALSALRVAQVAACALGGRTDEAIALVEQHGLGEAPGIPIDWMTYTAQAKLSVAAFELRDARLGAMLVEQLRPYAHHWAHIQLLCLTPNELSLGLACAAAGAIDEGIEHLRRGRELLRAHGLRSHEAWASLYLARALLERGERDDLAAAREVVADGAAAAERYELPMMAAQLAEL